MTEAPNAMIAATVETLRRHPPFDRMTGDSLDFLARRLKLAYYARGRRIVAPEFGIARTLHIIQRGVVHSERSDVDPARPDTIELAEGECFPLAAVVDHRASLRAYVAVEDTFCYEADVDTIEALVEKSQQFREFFDRYMSTLMRQSYAAQQASYTQETASDGAMNAILRGLVRRAPVTCAPGESLRSALLAMQSNKVGSIVVVDKDDVPIGIFTERDLLKRTVAGALDLDRSIDQYMTPSPKGLPATATAAEAALLMTQAAIRHVVVVEEGRLRGVVSERDLFALQRTSLRNIVHAIEIAGTTDALASAAANIRQLARNMLAQGVAAEQLTQLIATLNDRLVARVLELEARRHELAGITLCWIALGSEGRFEQTLATDQDNGIVFTAAERPEQARARLLPFAQAANRALDACGFPLCRGDMMAGNPEWCLSLEEWQAKFGDWIRNPLPKALLHSNIFYDFRPLWGDESLAQRLRAWLLAQVKDNQRFLRAMAENALESRPPLGFFTDFVTSSKKEARHTIDLKTQGTRTFVDAARIYALAAGIEQTNTAARLRLAGERLGVPREEVEAIVDAFHFITLLRLRQQHREIAPEAANRIDPDALNQLDRRILKEAFRQARKVQSRLALDYQL